MKSALAVLPEDPTIFRKSRINDAMLVFGIGNKKVEALKNWLRAMDLARTFEGAMVLTTAGRILAAIDPSLREAPTLWLLHLQLSLPTIEVEQEHDAWQWFASATFPNAFTLADLRESLRLSLAGLKDSALKNGLSELVKSLKGTPLGDMGLLRSDVKGEEPYYRQPAELEPFDTAVLLMAIGRQMERAERNSFGFAELGAPKSAGRILGLPFTRTVRALELASRQFTHHGVRISQTAGLDTIWLDRIDPLYWYLVAHGEATGRPLDPEAATALWTSFAEGGENDASAS